MTDNLPQIVAGIRESLDRVGAGAWKITFPDLGLTDALYLDVSSDGYNALLVRLAYGKRVLFDTGPLSSVETKEFKRELEKFLRWGIWEAKQPPRRPS